MTILKKLTPYLAKAGYRGCFAINSIVSEKDHQPYFIELTPRFGYPALGLDITLMEDNGKTVYDFFQAMVEGKTTSFFPTNKVAVTTAIFKMPFPDVKGYEGNKGVPISWDKKWDSYFFPYYIMGEKGKMVLSGDSGDVGQVTCVADNLDGAIQMLYDDYLPTLNLTSVYFRTDCGKDARKRIKALRDWGLI